VFPSTGLNIKQLAEAIQGHGLAPMVVEGDLPRVRGMADGGLFGRARLAATLAACIRSGYPALLAVNTRIVDGNGKMRLGDGHAVCVTGFREALPMEVPGGQVSEADENVDYFYVHDDNLGPNVRFELKSIKVEGVETCALCPSAPPSPNNMSDTNPTRKYHELVPWAVLIAVHDELRASPDALHKIGMDLAFLASGRMSHLVEGGRGFTVSVRFVGVRQYLGDELPRLLAGQGEAMAGVRLQLVEGVPPMSLHLGLVRLGYEGAPFADVLYDTTECVPRAFAFVPLHPEAKPFYPVLSTKLDLGVLIDAT
jgi:hypothetical protein